MKILKFPDQRLFVKALEVTSFTEELRVILDEMFITMVAHSGIGLAANQVGFTHNMFTMLGANDERLYIVNPKIIGRSQALANVREGCLSAPGEFLVRNDRVQWVQVQFQNELGASSTRVFKGLQAVCVEHEMEHLEGKGFMQSLAIPKKKRLELAKKWGL